MLKARLHYLVASLALAFVGPSAASAQPPAETALSEQLARCAIEKHPRDVRWLRALIGKEISLDAEVLGGALLNALGATMTGCMEGRAESELPGFVAALRRLGGSASTTRSEPMDALGDCLVRSAPEESMAFLRESDIGALRTKRGGFLSDTALQTMLSKSRGCGPILAKMGDRMDGNQIYSRINWLLRAGSKLGASK